ncbi:MAG: ankyrin repeat domain-containing protein, partial [Limisphaerales bacterium]
MKAIFCIVIFALFARGVRAQMDLTEWLEHGTFEEQPNQNPTAGIGETNGDSAGHPASSASAEAGRLANRIFGIEALTNTVEQARAVGAIFPEDSGDLQKMLMRLPKLQEQKAWLEAHPQTRFDEFNRTRKFVFAIGDTEDRPSGDLPGRLEPRRTNLPAMARLELQKELADIQQQVDFILGLQKAEVKALQAEAGDETAQQALQSPDVWNKVKDFPEAKLEQILPTLVPDSILISLLQQRNIAETGLARKPMPFFTKANRQEAMSQKAESSTLNELISNRVSGIMEALKIQSAISPHSKTENEEDQEIARLQEMIENSPDLINAPGEDGQSPLVDAAARGRLKAAAFLLDHGAEANAGETGGPPLVAAAKAGHRKMVELLLEHGADVNIEGGAALDGAIERGYETVAETLLKAYADVNATDNTGQTPLIVAAKGGKTKLIQMLLEAGANPNLADNDGVTALSSAALVNSPADAAPLKLLLAAKADPNGGGCDAPLLCAINNSDTNSAELLLHAGANPNLHGLVDGNLKNCNRGAYNNTTPLWSAVTMDDAPMVRLLLKYKADPNSSQINDTPVIFKAVEKINILQVLLSAGANPNVTNDLGRTPLSCAADNESPEAVKLLLAAGADPNSGSDDAPLLRAIETHDLACAELLLQGGADPNVEGITRWPGGSTRSGAPAGFSASECSATALWLAIDTHQV